jgi:molybdopterin converting factor small subunit
MRVRVLYFGVLRELFGVSDEVAELSDGAMVGDLLRHLRVRTSNTAMGDKAAFGLDDRLWRSLAVAVNREYGSQSVVLRDGDEVALLPPVSGGLLRVGRYCAYGEERASLASAVARPKARFAREGMPLDVVRERVL